MEVTLRLSKDIVETHHEVHYIEVQYKDDRITTVYTNASDEEVFISTDKRSQTVYLTNGQVYIDMDYVKELAISKE